MIIMPPHLHNIARRIGLVAPPRPQVRVRIVGNPAFWRCQKKLKRRMAGLAKPWKCPTCRMSTRQRVFKLERALGEKPAHYCLCCGTVWTEDSLLAWHPRRGLTARRKSIPAAWKAPATFSEFLT